MLEATLVLAGYVVGSAPFAYLVAHARGVDVLRVGTGNPGAANVFRQVGPVAGVAVFALDAGKAALPVALARVLGVSEWAALLAGTAALVGHWYPVFLRFRGGAGIAPAIGIGLGALPVPAAIGLAVGGAALVPLRSTGYATGLGVVAFLISALALGSGVPLTLAVAAQMLLVVVRRYLLPFHKGGGT
ncbi:MAG: glycerol-3-phosphate acyltransferase [Chloroflexi bacterium]|nr:glycerol-3-phosphate acyltransferase [Chloroflexota bacterium]